MARPKKFDTSLLNEKAMSYMETEEYPTIVDFCVRNKITRTHLYTLKKEDKALSDTLDLLVLTRENVLERKGLKGEYNSNLAKFALSQCGWNKESEEKREPPPIIYNVVPSARSSSSG